MKARCLCVRAAGALFFLLLSFTSCHKKVEQTIDFEIPGEAPLAYLPGVEWAVITDPVAAFREDAGFENKVLQHARKGDILEVTGKKIYSVKDSDGRIRTVTWYGFDKGWLVEDTISIYENRMNAMSASRKLLER
ncbi:MAG: hypothetical protein K6G18_07050 [Treponema sp.]|nr:hypothetical protein [Treponema sp.]